jgi:hypothetical protein
MRRRYLAVGGLFLTGAGFPLVTKAQTGLVDPRTTKYVCVLTRTQELAENGKPIILVLPCEAANVRSDSLTDADYKLLEKMQAERILFELLKTMPEHASEIEPTRSDFVRQAREVCERHPKIALLPLDTKAEQKRLSEITEAGGMALKTCDALR